MLNLDDLTPTDDNPFEFQFGGDTYTCRSPNEIDVRDLKSLIEDAQTDPAVQLRWMLGDEGWERLDAAEATFTIRHLQAVTEAWLAHYGLDAPKSGGSSTSSRTIRAS